MCNKYLDEEVNPLLASFEEKIAELDIDETKKKEYIAANEQYVNDYYNEAYKAVISVLSELM